MKRHKRMLSLLLAMLMLIPSLTATGLTALAKTGWVKSGDDWYYYDKSGDKVVNQSKKIDDKIYVFDATGKRVSKPGWYTLTFIDEDDEEYVYRLKFYIGKDGACKTGWQDIGKYRYYFSIKNGTMFVGINKIGKKLYMFTETGKLMKSKKGWYKKTFKDDDGSIVSANYYYFLGNGVLATGWKQINGKQYYFMPRAGMRLEDGSCEIKGKAYLFSKKGYLIKKKGWYWYKDSTGYRSKYYFDDAKQLVTGLKKIDGKYYYFFGNGVMTTGITVLDNGKVYYFGKDGALIKPSGWKKINGELFYFTKKGNAVTGWKTISGKKYYFFSYGARAEGLLELYNEDIADYDKYFLDREKGYLKTGWFKDGADTYCADEETGLLYTGWKTIDGKTYYFDPYSAVMAKGEVEIEGEWEYFDEVTGEYDPDHAFG